MFPGVDFLESVVDLGVVIDQELRMDRHVGKLSQSCFRQLRQLRTVPCVNPSVTPLQRC